MFSEIILKSIENVHAECYAKGEITKERFDKIREELTN
jgi:uncharacterized membrane protein